MKQDITKHTYATKKYKVSEYIYGDNNPLVALLVKIAISPVLAFSFPFLWIIGDEHKSYNGNDYVYSVGRKYWNWFFNPFVTFGQPIVGTETEKDLVDTVFEYETSKKDELPQDLRLDVFDGQTHFSIENGTSVSKLRKQVFLYAFPAQKRTITVSKGNIKKMVELNSIQIADAQAQDDWSNIQSYSDEQCFYKEKDLLSKIEDFRNRGLLSETGYTQIKDDIRRKSEKGKVTITNYEQEIEKIRLTI